MGDENEKYFIPCYMKFQYAVEESLPRNGISVQNLLSFEKIEMILHKDISDSCILSSHTTKLQKMQLSSIHSTTFFHNCYDFFQQFFI